VHPCRPLFFLITRLRIRAILQNFRQIGQRRPRAARHPILQRFNANTDWVSLCSADRQCPLNNWTACAKSMIICLSGAGIAHRLPGLGVMIELLILFHML
jgi:hypothetical protein